MKIISVNWQILKKRCHLALVKHQCHKYNRQYEWEFIMDGCDSEYPSNNTIDCLQRLQHFNRKKTEIKQEISQLKNAII